MAICPYLTNLMYVSLSAMLSQTRLPYQKKKRKEKLMKVSKSPI